MPCLLLILALLLPRLALFLIWLFTNWIALAFNSFIVPLLGFLFLPYTTLAYMGAMLNNAHQVSGLWLALIILAFIVDVSHYGFSRKWR